MNLLQPADAQCAAWSDAADGTGGAVASEVAKRAPVEADGPISIVDDDGWVCDSIGILLETYGYRVATFSSGKEFLEAEGRDKTLCLVIDQHMPELDGLDVVAALGRHGVSLPTILITGRLSPAIAERATRLGVHAILEKPFAAAKLIDLIHDAAASRP
jgi:two-component system, LuxR family, response regulator FixJ